MMASLYEVDLFLSIFTIAVAVAYIYPRKIQPTNSSYGHGEFWAIGFCCPRGEESFHWRFAIDDSSRCGVSDVDFSSTPFKGVTPWKLHTDCLGRLFERVLFGKLIKFHGIHGTFTKLDRRILCLTVGNPTNQETTLFRFIFAPHMTRMD